MAANQQGNSDRDTEVVPKSVELGKNGIKTTQDFANVMSALMSDVLAGEVSASRANAACNAGRQLIRAVELQLKYGTKINETTNERVLRIVSSDK